MSAFSLGTFKKTWTAGSDYSKEKNKDECCTACSHKTYNTHLRPKKQQQKTNPRKTTTAP